MMGAPDLPDWAAWLVAILLLTGSAITLIGTIGLVRLETFYKRVHAPTLGATLGAGCILLASIACFTVLQSRPILHEILIGAFVTITTPVTLILLVRAGVYRDRVEQNSNVPRDN